MEIYWKFIRKEEGGGQGDRWALMNVMLQCSLWFHNTQTTSISKAKSKRSFHNSRFSCFLAALQKWCKKVQHTYHQTKRSMSMDFVRNLERPPSISCHVHFAAFRGGKMPDDIFESGMIDQLSCSEGWPEMQSDWLLVMGFVAQLTLRRWSVF